MRLTSFAIHTNILTWVHCFVVQIAAGSAAGAADNMLSLQRDTHRSNMPGSGLVTARLVDVDMPEGPGTDKGRAPAHLLASPTGSDEVSRLCAQPNNICVHRAARELAAFDSMLVSMLVLP